MVFSSFFLPSDGILDILAQKMEDLAKAYVKIVLEIDTHDEGFAFLISFQFLSFDFRHSFNFLSTSLSDSTRYVDAYYGPSEWKDEVQKAPRGLQELLLALEDLNKSYQALKLESRERDDVDKLREIFMEKQVSFAPPLCQLVNSSACQSDSLSISLFPLSQIIASTTFVRELVAKSQPGQSRLNFDEESKLLYDAVAPTQTAADFQEILEKIKALLPGDEKTPLIERYAQFKDAFVIPKEKLEIVFKTAIAEARKRTLKWCQLPSNEEFVLEFVTGKPWSGYNWFKGNSFSVIQINTDLPIYIDRAIDLAAHEGYPGHHVNNALLEKNLVKERKWIEFAVYPLYSPQSFIAEGSANYGIDVCFPDRTEYESTVLFPLAGIDPSTAGKYYEVEGLVSGFVHFYL